MVKVKHITATCPLPGCDISGFVQVLVVPEKDLQPRIDRRARTKIKNTLIAQHKDGQHV